MFHGIRCGTPLFPFLCTLTTTTNVGSRGHVANKTILIVFLPHESSFSIDSPMSLPKAFSLGGIGYVRIKVKQKLDGHSVQVSCKKKRRNRFVAHPPTTSDFLLAFYFFFRLSLCSFHNLGGTVYWPGNLVFQWQSPALKKQFRAGNVGRYADLPVSCSWPI